MLDIKTNLERKMHKLQHRQSDLFDIRDHGSNLEETDIIFVSSAEGKPPDIVHIVTIPVKSATKGSTAG